MAPPGPSRFRFGLFEADPVSGQLLKRGRKVPLQDQPFRILLLLLEQPGTVVTRERLQQCLWPADTFVEFDHGLNTAIKKLRQALGDAADNPRFIETLPRKGYRFIAPVTSPEPAVKPPDRLRSWMAGAVCSIMAAAALVGWLVRGRPTETLAPPTPLTSFLGEETEPSFSPDGRQVAFSWNGEGEDNFDIYVMTIGTPHPVRLTTDPAPDQSPAWSPDGRRIAFARRLPGTRTGVFVVPADGGPEAKITDMVTPPESQQLRLLAWTPDAKWLVFPDWDDTALHTPDERPSATNISRLSLFLVSLETRERRRLVPQPEAVARDAAPAFSPEERRLAFVRTITAGLSDLYVVPVTPRWTVVGPPRRLTTGERVAVNPAWTPDGAYLVFAAGTPVDTRLWRVNAGGKKAARPTGIAAGNLNFPCISRRSQLVYTQVWADSNIWRLDLAAPGVPDGAPRRFIASTRLDGNPQYSPDGKHIAFASDRGGFSEIWIAGADGNNSAPLTSMQASITGGPAWSPDGAQVAFDSNQAGQWEVYVISAAGGTPRRLTENSATNGVPSWSHEGAWVYFMSTRSGSRQVWKVPAAGGVAVQVTRNGGHVAAESHDGRFVYYSKPGPGGAGLWRVPVAGGQESPVLPSVTPMNFALTREGIYFIPGVDADGRSAVHFFRFASGVASPVAAFPGRPGFGLAVSPDGRTLLYTQIDHRASDLMLVDGFH